MPIDLNAREGREAVALALCTHPEENDDGLPSCGCESAKCQAQLAIHDPAKLAEMIASEGRRLGFGDDAAHEVVGDEWRFTAKRTRWCAHDEIVLTLRKPMSSFPEKTPAYTKLPQAHAILAALLALPDGAKEAAERILRGDSNG